MYQNHSTNTTCAHILKMGSLLGSVLLTGLGISVAGCTPTESSDSSSSTISFSAEDFPKEERVSHGVQLRMASHLWDRLEADYDELLPGILKNLHETNVSKSAQAGTRPTILRVTDNSLDIRVPRTAFTDGVVLCTKGSDSSKEGSCSLHVGIRSFEVNPVGNHRIQLILETDIETRDLDGVPTSWSFRQPAANSCNLSADSDDGDHEGVAIEIEIDLKEETHAGSRQGLTAMHIAHVGFGSEADNKDLENKDIKVGPWTKPGCLIAGLLKGKLLNVLEKNATSLATPFACETPNDAGQCPDGTFAVSDGAKGPICRYENRVDAECVPTVFQFGGQGDVGTAAYSSASPFTNAWGKFMFAATGAASTNQGGISLSMGGGFVSSDSDLSENLGHHECVPVLPKPERPTVPLANAFLSNMDPTGNPTYLSLGLSESMLNYGAYHLFDSGFFCLEFGPEMAGLSTDAMSASVPSMKTIGFPKKSVPLSVVLRPQRPPAFVIGTEEEDPTLTITFPALELDFYGLVSEAQVKILTYHADLSIGVDFEVSEGVLMPILKSVSATKDRVVHVALITDSTMKILTGLRSLFATVPTIAGALIPPIPLPEVFGLRPGLSETTLVMGVEEQGERWFGVFASLGTPPPLPEPDPYATTEPEDAMMGGCNVSSTSPGETLGWMAGVFVLLGLGRRRRSELRRLSNRKTISRASLMSLLAVVLITSAFGCKKSNPSTETAKQLDPGILGTHLDAVRAPSGEIVLSGYSPGVPPIRRYGDLVVGVVEGDETRWEIVDGVPSSNEPATPGWRGGNGTPGDDVGEWTSIGRHGDTYYVSYYDSTNGALKVAKGHPHLGKSQGQWNIQVVDEQGDSGRYSSLAVTASGLPQIAYLSVLPPADGEKPTSALRVASMDEGGAWSRATVGEHEMNCHPDFCGEGQRCLAAGECIVPTDDCGDATADAPERVACYGGVFREAVLDSEPKLAPVAFGVYPKLVAAGAEDLGLVFLDRRSGEIRGTYRRNNQWVAPFTIAGNGVDRPILESYQRVGFDIAPNGNWHVAYAQAFELHHVKVAFSASGMVRTHERVDHGWLGGEPRAMADGRHRLGEAVVKVSQAEVRIAFQDRTAVHLMTATKPIGPALRTPGSEDALGWKIEMTDEMGSTGFHPVLVPAGEGILGWNTVTFWRNQNTEPSSGIRVH